MVIPQLKIPDPANFGGTGQKAVNKKKMVHTDLPPEITNYDTIIFLTKVFPINNSSFYISFNTIFTFLS